MTLLHFEDFSPGQTLALDNRYAVTKEEIVAFAKRYDPQPHHLDEDAAKKTILGGLAASGWHVCAMAMRMAAMAHLPPDPRPAFNVPLTCPNYPGPSITILMPSHALTAAQANPHIPMTRSVARVFARKCVQESPSRAHAGRGPPAANLS